MKPAHELLRLIEAAGGRLMLNGDRLQAALPPELVTEPFVAELRARTLELLALLEGRRGFPSPAPVPLRPARPDPAELARVLGLPLDRLDRVLVVRVPWWPEPLWFVPAEADAEALAAEAVSRGVIWTARELADLLAVPGITGAGALTVALAKLAVAGEVAEVRAAGPPCCYACKGERWWRSTAGRTVCATCHPPAAPGLVAEWREPER